MMGKCVVGRARMCLGVFMEHRQKWGNWVMERWRGAAERNTDSD